MDMTKYSKEAGNKRDARQDERQVETGMLSKIKMERKERRR
jgi:hypothetical protein